MESFLTRAKGRAILLVAFASRNVVVLACVIAAYGAAGAVCIFQLGWRPAIDQAINRLPATGVGLRHGRLTWPVGQIGVLGESPFLAVAVNLGDSPTKVKTADALIELRKTELGITWRGLGLAFSYPSGLELTLDGLRLAASWRSRGEQLELLLGLLFAGSLLGGWCVLAGLAMGLWRACAAIAGRKGPPWSAFRFLVAALLPGAWLMSSALWAYGLGAISANATLGTQLLHLAIDLLCLALVPLLFDRGAAPHIRA